MMQSFRRHNDTTGSVPSYWEPPAAGDVSESESEESEAESVRGGARPHDDSENEHEPFRGVPNTTNNPCGVLPGDAEAVKHVLACHTAIFQKKGQEALYCRVPQNRWKDYVVEALSAQCLKAKCMLSNIPSASLSGVNFEEWDTSLKAYFKKIDAGVEPTTTSTTDHDDGEEPDEVLTDDDLVDDLLTSKVTGKTLTPAQQAWKDALQRSHDIVTTSLASFEDKSTAIVRAAMRALQCGLFTVPASNGVWNTGQCVGFLLHAFQLQLRYNEASDAPESSASQRGDDSSASDVSGSDMRYVAIFTGAAGTGKTALLEAQDMLTQAVYESSSCVYRSAPTRTAARLNRGNTCHAAWHLPFGCSLGREGRLSDSTLKKLRKKLVGIIEATIDEISMLGPQKLFQIENRAKWATNLFHLFMGALKLRLSGDFLQLPPVNSAGFAGPSLDDEGNEKVHNPRRGTKTRHAMQDEDAEPKDEEEDKEAEWGLKYFRQIPHVICLSRVVRAPNSLGALCTCVRHCRITDAAWTLLQSRLVTSNDSRLRSDPFSTTPCKIIVQRHLLRSAMSNEAVLTQAPSMSSPVYLVTARDDVECADQGIISQVQDLLQQEQTLRKTGRKPSLLLLYEGARMLLEGKDCHLLGLMNGAEVIVEKIILSDAVNFHGPREIHPNVTQLKYMPEAVVVRVPDVSWILPKELLGPLHDTVLPEDLRGIFILRPNTTRPFKVMLNGIKWRVKRTQFSMIPANAVIVYGAQGESFESAIVDLGQPPGQDAKLFWLACYVMLTRCRSLSGLLILRLPPRDALEVGPPQNVKEEMERLKKLDVSTRKNLFKNLQRMLGDLPEEVCNLFSMNTAASDDVDWKQVDALLEKELAEQSLSNKTQTPTVRRGPC